MIMTHYAGHAAERHSSKFVENKQWEIRDRTVFLWKGYSFF